uniref:Uncharacterized protein n=1 Tax=Anguilla anguilla TaxID=7936 RepID=A0A0E9SYZ4_ANGAN
MILKGPQSPGVRSHTQKTTYGRGRGGD